MDNLEPELLWEPVPEALGRLESVKLVTWRESFLDSYGHDPRSSYAEQFWLSVLGPTTTWFLRICADALDELSMLQDSARDVEYISSESVELNLGDAARVLGIGQHTRGRSVMARTVARACRFNVARAEDEMTLAIRTRLPHITYTQLRRLPQYKQVLHRSFVRGLRRCDQTQLLRAKSLALSLVELGDAMDAVEKQLTDLKFSPLVVSEASQWAWTVQLHRRSVGDAKGRLDGMLAHPSIGPSIGDVAKVLPVSPVVNGRGLAVAPSPVVVETS